MRVRPVPTQEDEDHEASAVVADPYANETLDEERVRKVAQLAESGTLQEPEDEEDMWYGVRQLGEGGNGRAVLWLKLDGNNNIVDVSDPSSHYLEIPILTSDPQRMSIKDITPKERSFWVDPVYWRDGLPREIAIMQRLESLQHKNILKFRGYRLNMKQRQYRLYHDFCDYTDLYNIMEFYRRSYGLRLQVHRGLKAKRKKREDRANKRMAKRAKANEDRANERSDIDGTLRLY